MGMYNTLHMDMTCPHCGQTGEMEIDLYFGDTRNLSQFRMGDRYLWLPDKPVKLGSRPPDGSLDGEGYTECPNCGRDFFVDVIVRGDYIRGALANLNKPGYITQAVPKEQIPEQAEAWKPILEPRRNGVITPGLNWRLTSEIEGLLEKLAEAGVDVYSDISGSD